MDVDAPLDFETEDLLVAPEPARLRQETATNLPSLIFDLFPDSSFPISSISPVLGVERFCFFLWPRNQRIIGLDDLLDDFYAERSKSAKAEVKRPNVRKRAISDYGDYHERDKEALLSKFVDECEKQVKEIVTEEEILSWGLRVFGRQEALPASPPPAVGNYNLLKCVIGNEIYSKFSSSEEEKQKFLECLLLNNWLTDLVLASGLIEDSVALWTFHLLLYSPNENLQLAACDFWCSILLYGSEDTHLLLSWVPSYSELKDVLEQYGYLWIFVNCNQKNDATDRAFDSPPRNIRLLLKVIAACCESRDSVGPARMLAIGCFFTDDEWELSSKRVAETIAGSIHKELNCIRVVECISGLDMRSKHFRSELAYQLLINFLDYKGDDAEELLRSLASTNMKNKLCNFLHIYIYLVLADNWLLSNSLLEERPALHTIWGSFLRNCFCQITCTDWRSYASKVRNKASYLLQFYQCEQKRQLRTCTEL